MISSEDYPDHDRYADGDAQAEALRHLLRRTGGKVAAEVATVAREEFGVPRSTLFRLAARFRKTQRTSSLSPRKRGTQVGAVRFDPRTERVIVEQVDGFWLKKEKPSFAALLRRIQEVCLAEGLSPPHRNTVQRRVSELIPMSAARKRGEREIEAGDTQLARRLDQYVLPRWKADEEFQELVTAILRSLPLRLPSALSGQSLRHLSRLGDGITARVFGILNELAIEAIQNGTERITDENIESWKPALEKESAYA